MINQISNISIIDYNQINPKMMDKSPPHITHYTTIDLVYTQKNILLTYYSNQMNKIQIIFQCYTQV